MFLAFAFLTLFLTSPVYAQDASPSAATTESAATPTTIPSPTIIPTPTNHPSEDLYQKYKTDYLFLRDSYQKDYLTYVDKSRVYTKYGTVTTQKEKTDAAKTTIVSRNKMFKAYLMAIRTRLDIYQSSNSTDTEKVKIELSKWESWFDEQNQVVSSINNEKDLDKWAENFSEKYIEIQTSIYSALVRHEVNMKQEALSQIQSLISNVQSLPGYQSNDPSWINNLAIKTDLIKQSLDSSILLSQNSQNSNRFINFYPRAQENFAQAGTYLNEVVNDLKSVITKFIQKWPPPTSSIKVQNQTKIIL